MVCTTLQQCFLPYYNIFLPLKAKGSLPGMVAMSLESPYQVLMITQSPVSFEYRWIFFLKSLPYSCSCGNVPPPFDLNLVFLMFFHKYITGVFLFPIWRNSLLSANSEISPDTHSSTSLAKLLTKNDQESDILVILLLTFHHRMLIYFNPFIPGSMPVLSLRRKKISLIMCF